MSGIVNNHLVCDNFAIPQQCHNIRLPICQCLFCLQCVFLNSARHLPNSLQDNYVTWCKVLRSHHVFIGRDTDDKSPRNYPQQLCLLLWFSVEWNLTRIADQWITCSSVLLTRYISRRGFIPHFFQIIGYGIWLCHLCPWLFFSCSRHTLKLVGVFRHLTWVISSKKNPVPDARENLGGNMRARGVILPRKRLRPPVLVFSKTFFDILCDFWLYDCIIIFFDFDRLDRLTFYFLVTCPS